MPPILVKYRKLLSLTLANNAILFTESSITGHRVQIQMSVDDLNTFFVWQRASGTPRPIGHFLSDVSGVKFSDIVMDSLNKIYTDLDGNTDGLNFSSYVFDANTDSRTRGCGKVSSNDLVMAYILYKCYGSSTCPTANIIYNLEDAQEMLSSGAVSVSITTSFEQDEQLANLGGVNLGEVDAMFRSMLAAAPLRYFQANGTQIPGLFETNYACHPSDPPAQGSWRFIENDVLELRMTFAFQQPVAHESIDAVGSQSTNTVIKAGDTFSIRLQILATDTHSGAAAKAAAVAAAAAAAAAASATAQQQAAANAMLAAANAQQAVNSAAAQQQADAAQLQLIMNNHAEQQINVNNVAYIYGAAQASLNAAIVSGQAKSITQQTRANALAAAATLTQNQAVLANLSTQLVQTKLKYDASVSTLAGSQTVAAAALLTSANAANITASAALAAAQAAALTTSTLSDYECSFSTLQIQMLLSNAINPTLLLSNQIAFANASNTSLSIWQSALVAQAKHHDALSKATNAKQVMDMAIVLGEMANIQIMMANVNAYTTLEAKAKANLLSTNMALIGAAATEYTAYTTLLSNSNTAANLSNLLALEDYNAASRSLSTTVLNVSSLVSSDSVIQGALLNAQANLNSSIAGGAVASENTLLTSSFVGYTALATSSSGAVTRLTASSNLAQLLLNSMNSNVIETAARLSTITVDNAALLSTFSTTMATMMNYEQNVLANPSTIQTAQTINSAHITYNTMLDKQRIASSALTVAQRILDTAVANQASPQQIALLQGNVAEAQAKLVSAEAALATATRLYNSASLTAVEDPNGLAILSLAASTMATSISTALHNELATNLYSAISTQNGVESVLNEASLTYTLAEAALANAITAGKTIFQIQGLNAAVDSAKAAYSRAAIAASAASVAVSTAQAGVTADPNTINILESASLISYSTTQGALASGLVQEVTSLYEKSAVAAQAALAARLNYSTSVAALVSAVAGGAGLPAIQSLQNTVNSTTVVYATATQASIQAGTALINQERVATVNPLAKAILDTTSINLAAASISKSVQTYATALVGAEAVTASTLVAMGSAQTAYNVATTRLDTEIASGQSLANIQGAQSTLQAAGAYLAARTVAYNNSVSTLTQNTIFHSTSTAAYTSTLSQAKVSPLSDSIAVVTAQVAVLVVAVSTQTASLASKEVVHLASIAHDTQLALVSSLAGLSTISSITYASQSTLTGVSPLSSVSSISSYISTVQSDSLQLALATRSLANAQSAFAVAQAAASSNPLAPYIYTALANYASSANSIQPPPSAPTGLSSSAVTGNGFTVRWQGFTAASSYTFMLNGMSAVPTTQTSLSATFSGLFAGTQYTLVVTAANSKGTAPSAPFIVSTLSPPPTQPVLTVSNVTTSTAQINWAGAVGATSYSYTLNGIPTVPTVDNGLISKFIVLTGLSGETTYSVVVTAINTLGSVASAALTLTTAGPPTAITATTSAILKDGFTLNWTGGVNATSFIFVLNGSAATPTVSGTSAVFTGLLANTPYTVGMTATNTLGSVTTTTSVRTALPVFKGYWHPSLEYSRTDRVIKAGPFDTDRNSPKVYSCLVSTADQISTIPFHSQAISDNTGLVGTNIYNPNLPMYSVGDIVRPPLESVGVGPGYYLENEVLLCITSINLSGINIHPSGGYVSGTDPDTVQYWRKLTVGNPLLFSNPTNQASTLWSVQGDYSGIWSSTDAYLQGSIVQSPADTKLYLSINATPVGQPDPSLDTANWSLLGLEGGAPSPLTVGPLSFQQGEISFSWTGGEGAISYDFVLNGVSVVPSTDNSLTSQSVTFTGLTPGTSYGIAIFAINANGAYCPLAFTAITLPSLAILTPSSVTDTSFTVSWQSQLGVTSYSYSITDLSGGTYTPSTDTGMTAQNIGVSGLTGSTQYIVVVTAINASGSTPSAPLTVTTLAPPPPPTEPSVSTTVSSNTITATWTGGDGATSYSYSMTDASENTFTPSTVSSNTLVYSGLPPSTELTLIVTAINSSASVASSPVIVSTDKASYKGTWTAGVEYTPYDLILGSDGILYSCVSPTNAQTFTPSEWSPTTQTYSGTWAPSESYALDDIILNPVDNTLYVCIQAVSPGMHPDPSQTPLTWSPLSLAGSQPFPIYDISSTPTSDGFTIVWSGGTTATTYSYELADASGNMISPTSYTLVDTGVSAQTAVLSGLFPDTSYTILIVATNSYGFSENASIIVTLATPPPTEPILTVSRTSYTATVSWTGGEGATSYSYSITPSTDNGLSSKTIVYTELTHSTAYTVSVTATNTTGSVTSTVSFTTIPPPFKGQWTSGAEYTVGETVLYDGIIYTCVTSTSEQTFTPSQWSANTNVYMGVWTPRNTKIVGEIYVSGINNQLYICIQQDASNGTDPGSYGDYPSQDPYYSLLGSVSSGAYPAHSISVTNTVETATTEFIITWNNDSTVTSYSFSLTDGSGNTFTPVSDTSLTKSLRYIGLTPSTDYTFSIVATNSGGSSVPSIFYPRTASPPPPPSPMILSSTTTYNSLTASWTGGDGATSYAYVLNGSPIPPSTDNGLSGRTITFTGLVHSLSYSLTVTATNTIGSTSASLTITTAAKPTVQYNGPIANLTVINTTNTTATAKWTGCSSGTEYIYTLPSGALASFDSSTNMAFITRMNPKSTYPFVVKAISPVDTPMFIGTVGYPSCLEYSYDGITWDTIVSASKFVGVAQGATTVSYNNGLWIAGTNSSTPLLYSRNGFMWYASPSATIFLEIFRVASNGALWVAGGRGTNRMAYSYDGITWIPSSSGNSIFTQHCIGVAWNGSMWVACGKGTNSLAYSYDGITWTASPSGNLRYPQNSSIAAVAWASTTSIWVAAGQIMSYSYDGITWTAANRILNSAACLATNGSMWVAGGQNGYNNQVIYSMDGITWVSSPSADSFLNWWCSSVTWNGSLWVASGGRYGGSGSIIYSSDGITWAQSPRQMPAGYSGLAAGTGDLLTTASIEIKTITLNTDPNTFIASSITHDECVVSWTGGSASTTYTYTLNGVAATPSIDDAVIGHTVTFSGLTPSTQYIIAVTSRYDNAGTNLATSSLLVTTLAPPVDATPTNLATTNLTDNSLTLTWTGANTATSYAYFFDGIETTPSADNGVSANSADFTGLTPSTTYSIYIVATTPYGTYTSSSLTVTTNPSQPTQVLSIACTDNLGNPVNATNASSGPIVLTNFPGSQIVYTFTQTGANSPTISAQLLDSSDYNMLANTTSIPGTLLEVIQTLGGNSTLSSVTDVVTPNPFSYAATRPGFYINSATPLTQASTTLLINLDYTTNTVGDYYRTYDGTQFYTKVLVTVIDNLPNAGVTEAPSSSFILEFIVQELS